ncbi:MAG: Holliday junction resolvase RuvX [Armatimonadetes bacterium]|nr:Holliday junction resolvase RuvX [Armatimonadota bacterium]MDE2205282.1 Holliday junction resolvase RuvX [Armatimonadota bacterium]
MARFLGLDIGDARTGVAVSDANGRMALPVETVVRTRSIRQDAARIARLAVERDATAIVVGLPKMMNGAESEQASRIDAFIRVLRGYVRIPIHMQDERLTTHAAAQVLRDVGTRRRTRKGQLDAAAACIILQEWLDAQTVPALADASEAE